MATNYSKQGRRNRQRGAELEREVATLLGTERVGTRGKWDKTDGDVEHPRYYIQCKRRRRMAIYRLWDETVENADRVGKEPLLIIREDRAPALAVIPLMVWKELIDGKR